METKHLSGFSKEHQHDIKVGEGLDSEAHPAHKLGIAAGGNKQNEDDAPTGESNHETLRHNSRPKPEAVAIVAKEDPDCLAKARKYAHRSEHGGSDPNAVAGS